MFLPSRPMILPLISSLSIWNTVTAFSIAVSEAVRCIVFITILLASLLAPEGELLRIGVHPSYRKRGFGAQLMEKFLFKAREHACTDLFLEVRADNTAAIGLYRRFGFEDSGLRRAYYKDPPADALLMRRSASLSK